MESLTQQGRSEKRLREVDSQDSCAGCLVGRRVPQAIRNRRRRETPRLQGTTSMLLRAERRRSQPRVSGASKSAPVGGEGARSRPPARRCPRRPGDRPGGRRALGRPGSGAASGAARAHVAGIRSSGRRRPRVRPPRTRAARRRAGRVGGRSRRGPGQPGDRTRGDHPPEPVGLGEVRRLPRAGRARRGYRAAPRGRIPRAS